MESRNDTRRALVIAHEPDGSGGQVAVRLTQRGFDVYTHVVTAELDKPNQSIPFPDFASFDVVAIMGSIRSLTQKDQISNWVYDEMELIRKAHHSELPVLGICFGGQLISEALGGSVELSPTTEIGWHTIRASDGAHNPVGPGPWMEWHHDRFEPPPGAELLALTDSAPQLFRIDRIVGTQFHPEVDYDHVDFWMKTADEEYLASYGLDRNDVLAEVAQHEGRNNEQCHRLVDWFLDEVAFPAGSQGRLLH